MAKRTGLPNTLEGWTRWMAELAGWLDALDISKDNLRLSVTLRLAVGTEISPTLNIPLAPLLRYSRLFLVGRTYWWPIVSNTLWNGMSAGKIWYKVGHRSLLILIWLIALDSPRTDAQVVEEGGKADVVYSVPLLQCRIPVFAHFIPPPQFPWASPNGWDLLLYTVIRWRSTVSNFVNISIWPTAKNLIPSQTVEWSGKAQRDSTRFEFMTCDSHWDWYRNDQLHLWLAPRISSKGWLGWRSNQGDSRPWMGWEVITYYSTCSFTIHMQQYIHSIDYICPARECKK